MLASRLPDACTVCGGRLHGLRQMLACSGTASSYYPLCPPNYPLGVAKVPVYACRVNDCCGRVQERGGTGMAPAETCGDANRFHAYILLLMYWFAVGLCEPGCFTTDYRRYDVVSSNYLYQSV